MRLTDRHRQALKAVGDGATRVQLAHVVVMHEFTDLINWGLIACYWVEGSGPDVWRVTEAGKKALQASPSA